MIDQNETNNSTSVVHGGVLEFTAPNQMAYLPIWMMKKLGIEEGTPIMMTNVILPKAEYCRLVPHQASWINIAEQSRKSMYPTSKNVFFFFFFFFFFFYFLFFFFFFRKKKNRGG